jgi:hypothetical protein
MTLFKTFLERAPMTAVFILVTVLAFYEQEAP